MNRYEASIAILLAGPLAGLLSLAEPAPHAAGPLAGIMRLAEPALHAQDAPRAQQPTDFTGVQLKNRAPISNEVLKVKFPRPSESKLKNGMELLVLEEHRSPTIQVQIAVPASNLNDPEGSSISAATGSLMRLGTKTRDARSIAAPRRYTLEIRRVLAMLSSGFASSTRKSAFLPGDTMPNWSSPRSCAELRVAAVMTSLGVRPALTRLSISICELQP